MGPYLQNFEFVRAFVYNHLSVIGYRSEDSSSEKESSP